ncbi:MAG: tetratricopeptide repeat protein [Atopobiaceae bacterium]|nr:tetratricopeptide repeat protein [Atopobiaceae bacterium]MBR3314596.1 tetratricopeptide repeat protein [Atopobiaceae bacterium]
MAQKPKEKELGGARKMSRGTKIVIGVFAVIMALSMMLPSLSAIFAGGSAEEGTEQADAAADTQEDAEAKDKEDKSKAEDEKVVGEENIPENDSFKSLAETNVEKVKKFKKRLDADENNLAALLNLGQIYMEWGYSAHNSASTDEETTYAKNLLNTAIEYFDRYLKLNDSATVKIDRALSQYYAGDSDAAIKALQKVSEEYPENPLCQAQLGYLYESQSDVEKASAAYRKAAELDEDERYGVKSYANQRLISLNSKVDSIGDAGDASIESSSDEGQSELLEKLKGDSNVGF